MMKFCTEGSLVFIVIFFILKVIIFFFFRQIAALMYAQANKEEPDAINKNDYIF